MFHGRRQNSLNLKLQSLLHISQLFCFHHTYIYIYSRSQFWLVVFIIFIFHFNNWHDFHNILTTIFFSGKLQINRSKLKISATSTRFPFFFQLFFSNFFFSPSLKLGRRIFFQGKLGPMKQLRVYNWGHGFRGGGSFQTGLTVVECLEVTGPLFLSPPEIWVRKGWGMMNQDSEKPTLPKNL